MRRGFNKVGQGTVEKFGETSNPDVVPERVYAGVAAWTAVVTQVAELPRSDVKGVDLIGTRNWVIVAWRIPRIMKVHQVAGSHSL
jgi:hypothetical protein